jgi:hypothetical protein
VEHLADGDAVAGELRAGRLDVVDDEVGAADRAGGGVGDAGAEVDRRRRPRRRQLHDPGGAEHDVGVLAPAEGLVEVLGPVDVGDGQDHDFELHVHDRDSSPASAAVSPPTTTVVLRWPVRPRETPWSARSPGPGGAR